MTTQRLCHKGKFLLTPTQFVVPHCPVEADKFHIRLHFPLSNLHPSIFSVWIGIPKTNPIQKCTDFRHCDMTKERDPTKHVGFPNFFLFSAVTIHLWVLERVRPGLFMWLLSVR